VAGTPVLYIAGTGRSGSTVLANVLGEVAGCVSVGELRYLWERGLIENRLCGCGAAFLDCPFWGEVLQAAFGDALPDAARMQALQGKAARMRSLPRLLLARGRSDRVTAGTGGLPEHLQRLYAAVLQVSGARVVVDSSKLPSHAVLLDSTPGLDVTVVHLVRDPRAAAFSWRRKKEQPDRRTPGYMERRGVGKSVALWLVWNAAIEFLWRGRRDRYVRVSYEDFVADPRIAVTRICAAAGIPVDTAATAGVFLADRTVRLGVSHTVAGNPARLRHGPVALRLDDEWASAMPVRDRLLVTVGAAPLLGRYGYPVLPGPRGSAGS
jgi:Sulfotransferase family